MTIDKVEHCAGCFLCTEVCPKKCISISYDKLGHMQPHIDTVKCVDCGACVKVCPELCIVVKKTSIKVLASWDKDNESREKSSSGGLATSLSRKVIEKGGVVYGCAFVQPFSFEHIRCSTIEDVERLRGSKYVQSDTSKCWSALRQDVKQGLRVLFIGTPCQVAAARRAVNDADNFLTIDLICHGVPSLKILKDSLPKKLFVLSFDKVEFRDSTNFHFSAKRGNSVVYDRILSKDWYLKGFFTALYYRDSCYFCKYANEKRCGDITLGDFWGVDKKQIDTDIEKGLSLVMINTNKGELLVDDIKDEIFVVERPVEEAIAGNKQLSKPVLRRWGTRVFSALYPYCGFKLSLFAAIPAVVLKNILLKR